MANATQERRFGFGDNWLDFARDLQPDRIERAEQSLRTLVRCASLAGQSFIDVGSGSGLFSLAARRLGARVHSFDYDPASVRCTDELKQRYFAGDPHWTVEQGSILDGDYVRKLGHFDVVYSWGVLHHTGAMRDALRSAAGLVKPGRLFAFALYHRTLLCGFWRQEKRWYAAASPRAQERARNIYVKLLRLRFALTRKDFHAYVTNYQSARGMSFFNDVHDWMGGYPYESILAPEVEALMQAMGFVQLHNTATGITAGVFGSGCDEYLYRRPD
jgi:2-polyprenyl-6-hydroxyphenyl methylase/3-demethylubiquinone-9 3-methyltransferase